jgi:hypothetical protein
MSAICPKPMNPREAVPNWRDQGTYSHKANRSSYSKARHSGVCRHNIGARNRTYNSELAGPCGPGHGTDMNSSEPRGTHWTPPETTSGPRSSSAFRRGTGSPNFRGCSRSRRHKAQARLTVPMVIEESRILQVSIFSTLQRNFAQRGLQ